MENLNSKVEEGKNSFRRREWHIGTTSEEINLACQIIESQGDYIDARAVEFAIRKAKSNYN
jgi:hypothetical protein